MSSDPVLSRALHDILLVPGNPTAFRPSHTPVSFRNTSAASNVWLRHTAHAILGGGLASLPTCRASFLIVALCHHFSCNRLIASVVARALYFHD